MGVTRTAVYYYFDSKESMLETLTQDVTQKAGELAHSVSRRKKLPPSDALRQLVLQHAELILQNPLQFRVVERSESSLPEPHRSSARLSRRAVLDHFTQVIQHGIDTGHFRAENARMAAFSIIGMYNWCAWWFDADGELSSEQVARSPAEFSLRALAPDQQPADGASTIEGAVSQIRNALTVFEAQVQRLRSK